jgi:hypothetical protein
LGLELGYRLIALVDKTRQGDLLNQGVRRKFAQRSRIPSPAVRAVTWSSSQWFTASPCGGAPIVGREAFPGNFQPINPGGITTTDRHGDDRPCWVCQHTGSTMKGSRTSMGLPWLILEL